MQELKETYNNFMAQQPSIRIRVHRAMKKLGIGLTLLSRCVPINFNTLRKFIIDEREIDYKTLIKIEKWLEGAEKHAESD